LQYRLPGRPISLIELVRWLHVSDFHFVADGDEFSQQEATRALLQDVSSRVGGSPISFVLVTGDVAYSGQRSQYGRASEFLSELASVSQVPANRFFFVPGNHDVDRNRQALAFEGARQVLTSQPAVDRVLGTPEEIGHLIERQAMFWEFVHAFTADQERTNTDDGLAYVAPVLVGGLKFCILGLNSAWLSGHDAEEMKLLIGERQILSALRLAEALRPQLQIAMAHHPVAWLQEWDQVSCHHRLLSQVDFYHRGHLHQPEVALTSSPDRPCLSIAAGSSHATRFYANSYNLIALDLGAGTCTVSPFRYEPNPGRFERAEAITSPVQLRGSLPGGLGDLAYALATSVPAAAGHAGYLAALIHGHQAEIPVRLGDNIEFVTPEVANELAPTNELTEAVAFLRLRNLLRLYDAEVPLPKRISEHGSTVEGFAARLLRMASEDRAFGEQLAARHLSGQRIAGTSTTTHRPHATELLLDLRNGQEWELLEVQASRFVDSPDPHLSRVARMALAETLMRSDQAEKREEAARLARALLDEPDATVEDYLLAAGSAEVTGDDTVALECTKRALAMWPDSPDLHSYARGLASRSGDASLRAELDAAKGRKRAL
jgi:predicted MPP superfamily phosphohydrolase